MQATSPQRSDQETLMCNVREAAEFLGVSVTTLRRWRHNGNLVKGVHFTQYGPSTIRYNRHWLEKFRASGGKGAHKLEVIQALKALR